LKAIPRLLQDKRMDFVTVWFRSDTFARVDFLADTENFRKIKIREISNQFFSRLKKLI
jgi:hypothetical protein